MDDVVGMRDTRTQISIRGVSRTFRSSSGSVVALDNVSLDIGSGEFVSFLGPSGCGKTTLLRLIGGLDKPDSGSLEIDGGEVATALQQRSFGFVFQDAALPPWKTTVQNIQLLAEVSKRRITSERIDQLIHLIGLTGFEGSYPHQLSGGMQQRVALARALAMDPRILLMDEPFAALDALTRDRMGEELLRIWDGLKTVVFVTHSIPEAVFLSDKVVVLSARPGRIYACVDIDLPRPRTKAAMATPAANKYLSLLRNHIDAQPST